MMRNPRAIYRAFSGISLQCFAAELMVDFFISVLLMKVN